MPHVEIKGVGMAKFPDDMPVNDIRAFLQRRFSDLRRVAEPAATIATSAVAEPIAGLAGIAQAVNPFAEPGAGARAVEATREALTFIPASEEGREGLEKLAEVAEPLTRILEAGEKKGGEIGFEFAGPAGGAAGAALFGLALELNPAGKVGKVVKALPLSNTIKSKLDAASKNRLARAQEQGFDTGEVLFHGTKADITSFDPSKGGLTTQAANAKGSVFLASNPEASSIFASLGKGRFAAELTDPIIGRLDIAQKERIKLGRKHTKLSNQGKETEADSVFNDLLDAERTEKSLKRELLSSDIDEAIRKGGLNIKQGTDPAFSDQTGANILPVFVRKEGFKNVDLKGAPRKRGDFAKIINKAKKDGERGVIIRNTSDPIETDVIVAFNPEDIRSINASFDPKKKRDIGVLAGASAAGIGVSAISPQGQLDNQDNTL